MVEQMQMSRSKLYSYAEITKIATFQIAYYMSAARRGSHAESAAKREIAYGVYMGWRALVESHPDREAYLQDDKRLDALVHAISP